MSRVQHWEGRDMGGSSLVCNHFDVSASVLADAKTIEFSLRSDLPPGTLVILSVQRKYLDYHGQPSIWVGHSERFALGDSRDVAGGVYSGFVDTFHSDTIAYNLFRRINTDGNSSTSSLPSNELDLIFTVGLRQQLKVFGKNNAFLSGSKVSKDGNISIVRAVTTLKLPLDSSIVDAISSAT
jgi:hypothetical protein